MAEEIKLKPCPFCGSAPHINFDYHAFVYYAICTGCGCRLGGNHKGEYGSPEETAQEWNNRVTVLE